MSRQMAGSEICLRAVKHTQSSKSRFATGMEKCFYFGKYLESSEQEKFWDNAELLFTAREGRSALSQNFFLLAGLEILTEI